MTYLFHDDREHEADWMDSSHSVRCRICDHQAAQFRCGTCNQQADESVIGHGTFRTGNHYPIPKGLQPDA